MRNSNERRSDSGNGSDFGNRRNGSDGGRSGGNRFGRGNGGGFNREPRQMHKVVCSECHQECEVPFKPTEGKPVYCRDCFNKHKPKRF